MNKEVASLLSKPESTAKSPVASKTSTVKVKEKSEITSGGSRLKKNPSNLLNEKDDRPGKDLGQKTNSVKSVKMAKTQPMSEMRDDVVKLTKKDTEIQAAVDLQKKLARKISRHSERRKNVQLQETTAQNRTQEQIDILEFINRHYLRVQPGVHKMKYTKEEYDNVIYEASQIFMSEKSLIDLDPPCVVVGDLHGQFNDLINMFILLGRPPETVYVFTGDYVDRGAMSVECIMLLFAYKICYPTNIILLRGNHEIARVNKKYGFYEECIQSVPKHGEEIWALFQRCFNNLPIAALLATKIMCMHGGLSPSLIALDDLRNHKKPIRNPFRGIVNDMLWADPDPSVFEWKTSSRGSGFVFGNNVIDDVCSRLGLELIIRAHQMCFDGYWTITGHKLITIFSAPVYCNLYKNAGGVLKVDEKLCVQLVIFVPESPGIEKLIKQSHRVWEQTVDTFD